MARLMTDSERSTIAATRPKFVHPAIGAVCDMVADLSAPSFRAYALTSTSVPALFWGRLV